MGPLSSEDKLGIKELGDVPKTNCIFHLSFQQGW